MDPTLVALFFCSLAAAAAALGALPLVGRTQVPSHWIGWANALAAGLMLGAAYTLTEVGLSDHPVLSGLGALLGVGFIYWTHEVSGTEDLDLNRLADTDAVYGYKIVLVNTLHSAAEGVAIGVAFFSDLRLGIFMALAMAVHNVPEATVLCSVLRSRGVTLPQAAGMAVVTNVTQILLAVVTLAVLEPLPDLLPTAAGVTVGALIYLLMVELVPESYREAGPTSIALVTSAALTVLVLLHGVIS